MLLRFEIFFWPVHVWLFSECLGRMGNQLRSWQACILGVRGMIASLQLEVRELSKSQFAKISTFELKMLTLGSYCK